MKKLLVSVAAAALLASAGAAYAAGSFSKQVTVTGTVEDTVKTSSTSSVGALTATSFVDANGNAAAGVDEITVNNLSANFAAKVGVTKTSNFLKHGSATCTAAGPDCVAYAAKATWKGLEAEVVADATDLHDQSDTGAVGTDDLKLKITRPVGSVMLNSGDFTDTVTVAVSANP